jgi:ferredoxin-NADP reductase/MOSC domain-containing protein YiiM
MSPDDTPETTATLLSVNVGMPRDVSWSGRTVHTGVWKHPVPGPRLARRLNLDGDGQGDLAGHGGEQRAVLVYQNASYEHWQEHFGVDRLEYGAFGENLTVDGLGDDEVCIGDRFGIGTAEFEVTQPRVTCFRVGMRLDQPQLPALLVSHRRPGFYMRVIHEGEVQAGDPIVRTARGRHAMSVAEVDGLLYLPGHDLERVRLAADIPALSPGWQGSFRSMLVAAESGAGPVPAGVPDAAPPGWAGFRALRVAGVVAESAAVTSYHLVVDGDDPLPRPTPGQYLTVRIPDAGSPTPVRSYSLSGSSDQPAYRISVKREPHGLVSSYLHAQIHRGGRVEVAAPRGDFVLDGDSNPVLLISAGIGITPVLAILHQLAEASATRDVWWIHTTHDARTHVFADEVGTLVQQLPAARSLVYYSGAVAPTDGGPYAGRLDAGVIAGLGLPADASAYVCGPESFMDDVTAALTTAGIAPARIHTERFGSRSAVNPGVVATPGQPPHQPPGPLGAGPGLTFARSAITAPWTGSYPSILELAEACDVPTAWSCRTGVCHTCITAVISGRTTYTTPPLEPPGAGEVLICCAQPDGELVLDL